MKVLIIRFSSIGDIILTTPVVRGLSIQLNAEVHYLTKPQFVPVLSANPYVSKIIPYTEARAGEVIRQLKEEHYDWIADLHHNLRSLRIKRALRRPGKAFPKLNIEKWLMVNLKINRLPDVHIVDRYLATVHQIGVKADNKGLDHFIPRQEPMQLSDYGLEKGHYTAIAVGAAHATKCLEDVQIVELISLISGKVVLLGGPSEVERAKAITADSSGNVVNLCGVCSINGSALVVRDANVVISPDTAMMHLAAAFRTPLISVWGNTIPEFGMYPYYGDQPGKHVLFETRGLSCRPCSKIGYAACPKGHFRCIRDLDLERIAALANSGLDRR